MTTENEEKGGQRGKWHLERSINVGHILTMVIIAAPAFLWAGRMDSRVTVLEINRQYLAATDQRLESQSNEKIAQLRDDLKEINRKLDRLIDIKNGNWRKDQS